MATSRAMPTPFLFVHNETCVFWALGFHVYTSLIIAFCSQENIISVKPLNNMHADTLGAGPCLFQRGCPIQKLISRGGICLFSEVILYYK